jgi:hypothetical protein
MFLKRGDVSSRYIPRGARKVADRASDAVVYVYERNGKPKELAYCGRRAKPDWHYSFRSEAERAENIRRYFAERQRQLAWKTEQKAKPGHGRKLQVGNILATCWGYEQTNIEFFQVTALIGSTMVELRELRKSRKDEGWCREAVAPIPDEFHGEPIRRRVSDYDGTSVRIDDVRRAWLHGTGVAHATSYA